MAKAHWRKNRPTTDLSDGWGSNSQWRTRFRWDFMLDGVLTYNAGAAGGSRATDLTTGTDGADPLRDDEPSQPQLSIEHRRELLMHRCFITIPERAPLGDEWPYDDYLQLPA